MVRYFLKAGDEEVSNMFSPYLRGESGFGNLIKRLLAERIYGDNLTLLLIQYYVMGKFEVFGPDKPEVGNYKSKEKSIAVAFTVSKNDFENKDEIQRREYIIDTTILAIQLINKKLESKKILFDIELLMSDIKECAKLWLEMKS